MPTSDAHQHKASLAQATQQVLWKTDSTKYADWIREVNAMSQKRKPKTTTNGKSDNRYIHWVPEGSQPSQVSGIFKDDPTFEEFCEILQQQREEDYQQANEEIEAMIRKEKEAKRCSSSIPTPSRTTKMHTQSSSRK